MKFLFDLDGTITATETLPVISEHFGCSQDIATLTAMTVGGRVPFAESLVRRVGILGAYPVSEVSRLLAEVPLHEELVSFIESHREDCIIVTGNLNCWCEKLFAKLGCRCYGTSAEVKDDTVVKIESILNKEQLVDRLRAQGEKVVFIGDGYNDLEAMRHADVSIAVGFTHAPLASLVRECDYSISDEKELSVRLESLQIAY